MREKFFKSVLLVLIGVIFFGCSSKTVRNVSDKINDTLSIDDELLLYQKNKLSQIVDVEFTKDGEGIKLVDKDNDVNILNFTNLELRKILKPSIEKIEKRENKVVLLDTQDVNMELGSVIEDSNNPFNKKFGFSISTKDNWDEVLQNIAKNTEKIGKFEFDTNSKNGENKFILNPNKKLKALINENGSVSIYSTKINKKLLTIKLFKNQNRGKSVTIMGQKYENTNPDSWLAITPEGYYVGSADAYKYFDVDKYYQKFYRPEIVKLALQGESIEGLPKISDIKSPPTVEILTGVEETAKESIEIKVAVTAKNGGVGKIQIFRNGTSIAFETKAFRGQKKEAIQTYEIQLLKGKNEIKALAFDSTNSVRTESSVYTIRSTYTEPHKKSIYALVIGIQEFVNGRFDLKNTIADAKLFEQTLMNQKNNGLFHDVNVVTLITKEETTKENILNELKKMRNIHPEDLFVLYMGSHGEVNDDGKYYLIPSDINDDSSQSIIKHAISENDIKELVGNIQTAQKFMVFDTCKAGSIANTLTAIETLKANKGVDDKTALNTLGHSIGKGAMIMGASTAKEVANEKYKGHGLFTYVLVDGLNGEAETNGEEDIQGSELKDYVYKNVKAISKEVMPRQQTPIINYTGEPFSLSRVR